MTDQPLSTRASASGTPVRFLAGLRTTSAVTRVAAVLALWVGAVLAATPAAAAAPGELEVPYLSGRVVDQAGLLDATTAARVEARLAALERDTGAQVAVLTLPELGGAPIEDYALRVAETWRLGRAGEDDGAVLVIARDDRRMRLEVGYGLEGVIPDALARRVLDDVIAPRFRDGDFAGGVAAGVDAIAGLVGGDAEALPQPVAAPAATSIGMPMIIVIAFMVLLILSARRRYGHGGFRGGGFPGGGFSGGGFSGGGFSGGGGSFGGGGASGSW